MCHIRLPGLTCERIASIILETTMTQIEESPAGPAFAVVNDKREGAKAMKIEIDGQRFDAVLETDKSPATCAAFRTRAAI